MLKNILNYFTRAIKDEGLAATCFTIAAERYLSVMATGALNEAQLSLATIEICKSIRREYI